MATKTKTPTTKVGAAKFKAQCLRIMNEVRRTGRPVTVTKRGVPLVEVLPAKSAKKRWTFPFGCMAGTARTVGDIVKPAVEWDCTRTIEPRRRK